MSLDVTIAEAVAAGVKKALADVEFEPLVYTVPAAARALRVSPDTVRDLIADGLLPTVPHMGRRHLIPRRALVAFVESAITDTERIPS